MAKLLEAYAKRVQIAEGVYAKEHDEPMSREKKLTIACLLNNANRYLQEAFENSVGTQRADIHNNKKFILNLTNIAMPNLVAFDLVMVKPMTSRSGFVTYVEYVAGSNKGGVAQGDVFNSSLGFSGSFGEINEDRARYTSAAIVEDGKAGEFVPSWKPLAGKVEQLQDGEWVEIKADSEGKFELPVDGKVRYLYDNEIIPANDLPIINARTREIPLIAKARRIAVYYSQLAAYEMKMEMGEDLGQNLSEQAVSELKFEIDNEIIFFLKKLAGEAVLEFNKALPVGVNKRDHYDSFLEVVEEGRTELYNRTHRYSPNYMVCAADVLQVLAFCTGFKGANAKNINGPYMAGTLNGMKVIVSPALASGEFFFGVNEGNVSAAVYAPYMAIVPTQLLGFADGGMSQGWSTLYALEALNKDLVVAGKIVNKAQVSYWATADSEA